MVDAGSTFVSETALSALGNPFRDIPFRVRDEAVAGFGALGQPRPSARMRAMPHRRCIVSRRLSEPRRLLTNQLAAVFPITNGFASHLREGCNDCVAGSVVNRATTVVVNHQTRIPGL